MSLAFIPAAFTHDAYEFRKADWSDLPRIRIWLNAPHIAEWWTPTEDELSASLSDEAGQAAYLVEHNGLPFAFIYVCDPAHDPDLANQIDYPKGTVRIEQFVGDSDMIGHGHGVKFIKAFVAAMQGTTGISRLLALPARENIFAQRSYSQAGLRAGKTIEYRHLPHLLMARDVA